MKYYKEKTGGLSENYLDKWRISYSSQINECGENVGERYDRYIEISLIGT